LESFRKILKKTFATRVAMLIGPELTRHPAAKCVLIAACLLQG